MTTHAFIVEALTLNKSTVYIYVCADSNLALPVRDFEGVVNCSLYSSLRLSVLFDNHYTILNMHNLQDLHFANVQIEIDLKICYLMLP